MFKSIVCVLGNVPVYRVVHGVTEAYQCNAKINQNGSCLRSVTDRPQELKQVLGHSKVVSNGESLFKVFSRERLYGKTSFQDML